jgi:Ca2+-binding RTX toxin-like protein
MRRTCTATLLIVMTAVLAAPATAAAATSIDLTGGELVVVGDAFSNDIQVRRVNDGYVIRDSRAALAIEAGSPCFVTSSARPPDEAKCVRNTEAAVRVESRAGDDIVTLLGGTRGADLDGEGGDDSVSSVGGSGPDSLFGGPGVDRLRAGDGDDRLVGEEGPDVLEGGPGIDTASYAEREPGDGGVNVTLADDVSDAHADDGGRPDGPSGQRDSIQPDVENATGGEGSDTLVGNNASNVLGGRGGADVLSGRGGDDLLNGGPAADVINGDDGADSVSYADRTAPVTVTLDGQRNDGDPRVDAFDIITAGVEGALGGSGPDTLVGDGGPNRLDGRGGGDTLDGRAGSDDITGGDGRDGVSYFGRDEGVSVSLNGAPDDGNADDFVRDNVRADVEDVSGTSSNDVLVGSDSGNLLQGFDGDNRLEGRGGADTLRSGVGTDLLDGGDGVDTASYEGHPSLEPERPVPGGVLPEIVITLDGLANDGIQPAGNTDDKGSVPGELDNVLTENVTGSGNGDVITGDAGPNALSGRGGGDTLRGGGGDDSVDGGLGLDVMSGEAGGDLLRANDGLADRVDCGPDPDIADLDLADGPGPLRGGAVLPASAGCEFQNIAPVGRLPNVALAGKTVAVDPRGRAQLALRCPRRSHRRCAGIVRLQRLDGTDLGAARFGIRRGGHATVAIRLRRAAPRGPAQILARERDVDGRPKLTFARVRVRR